MCETQLLLKNSPNEAHGLILHMQSTLHAHGVKLNITEDEQVKLDGEDLGCSGYFDSDPLEFAVALGKPFNDWFKVYMHEYSHFEQWLDDPIGFSQKCSEISELFSWVEDKVELSAERLKICTQSAIWIEYDCERRVLEKIERQGIQHLVCPKEYAQLANAYFNFYHYVAEAKSWYQAKREPYSLKEVYRLFPTHLVQLDSLTPELREAYALCV